MCSGFAIPVELDRSLNYVGWTKLTILLFADISLGLWNFTTEFNVKFVKAKYIVQLLRMHQGVCVKAKYILNRNNIIKDTSGSCVKDKYIFWIKYILNKIYSEQNIFWTEITLSRIHQGVCSAIERRPSHPTYPKSSPPKPIVYYLYFFP